MLVKNLIKKLQEIGKDEDTVYIEYLEESIDSKQITVNFTVKKENNSILLKVK